MVRRTSQPEATREEVLECIQQTCPWWGGWMWNKYDTNLNSKSCRWGWGGCAPTQGYRPCTSLNLLDFQFKVVLHLKRDELASQVFEDEVDLADAII